MIDEDYVRRIYDEYTDEALAVECQVFRSMTEIENIFDTIMCDYVDGINMVLNEVVAERFIRLVDSMKKSPAEIVPFRVV